jgi:aryl-alcohol dehydrogenase-like predicted oxidoreductase
MHYATLGATGLFVSRFCLGTMTFGGADTAAGNAIGRLDAREADRILGAAMEAGINMLDTADVYGMGGSEEVLGEILAGRRHELVVATKASARTGPGVNDLGQSRHHMMAALDGSLKRLKTDYIDLYQLHNFDPLTPAEVALRTLDDMVRSGKVRHVGCSNFAAWQLMKALGLAARLNLEPFVSIQAYYSLAGRDVERELLPLAQDQGLGLLCWSPLAGGLLSGKFDRSGTSDATARRARIAFPPVDEEMAYDVIDALRAVSDRHTTTPAQVALAWLLSRKAVTSVIIGVKRPDQLQANLGAFDLALSAGDLAQLDAASALPACYPGWIQSYNARSRVPEGHPWEGKSWTLGEAPE